MDAHKHKIFIAEDHTILREGLKAMFDDEKIRDRYQVVGEAVDGLDAVHSVERKRPNLVLMDLSMPRLSGIDAIREIKRQSPDIRVLVLTVHEDEEYIIEVFKAGADGYVLKDSTKDELLFAVENVVMGKRYICTGISNKVIDGFLDGRASPRDDSVWQTLSPREREVLKLVAEGYKNREISEYLFISEKTVKKHRANIMRKIGARTVSALTAYAIKKGLVA
ncbi:MAG: response regulator transcription factor [Deltaproteobacteria bacterium]|nr:response regulator transcription factor [Candidatus Zymogenaceae bacterium]